MKNYDSFIKCDLHIHTTASDGTLSAAEIISAASRAELDVIAITDHDTLDGLYNLPVTKKLRVISGIELSLDVPGNEVHILGLGINPLSPAWTSSNLIAKLKDARADRIHKMCSNLRALGYAIEPDEVFRLIPAGASPGRGHIAEALLNKNLVPSIGYVFQKLLGVRCPAYAQRYKIDMATAIDTIAKSGGVSVMAHPGLCFDDELVLRVIKAGVKGLEVFYPRHSRQQMKYYLSLCQKYNLCATGGSDYHGKPGRFPAQLGNFYYHTKNLAWLLEQK